ncbi:hypothetical protein [Candidatus Methanoliparum sp. LAM-1]|uniref:hypothetical protein n=1 Tax=Candidatus Methanoliparum sp. LAM-1 TaxID=2874846 RepID=UPI001E2D985B|nr:hypothetical protein [Candidatus Methanoliparum sp. LAM-1]
MRIIEQISDFLNPLKGIFSLLIISFILLTIFTSVVADATIVDGGIATLTMGIRWSG